MRARHLREGFYKKYTAVLEIRREPFEQREIRHLLSCLTTVHHCLFLRPHHSWIHGESFEIYNPKMNREQFVFFRRCHRWVSGPTVVVMLETASIK